MRLWPVAGTQVGRPGKEGARSAFTLVYLSTHSFEEPFYRRRNTNKKVSLSTSNRVREKKKCEQIKEEGEKPELKQKNVLTVHIKDKSRTSGTAASVNNKIWRISVWNEY